MKYPYTAISANQCPYDKAEVIQQKPLCDNKIKWHSRVLIAVFLKYTSAWLLFRHYLVKKADWDIYIFWDVLLIFWQCQNIGIVYFASYILVIICHYQAALIRLFRTWSDCFTLPKLRAAEVCAHGVLLVVHTLWTIIPEQYLHTKLQCDDTIHEAIDSVNCCRDVKLWRIHE